VLDLLVLVAGVALVVAGAELFFEALLGLARRLGVPAFTLTALVSGFEVENLAAGIAANAHGLGGAAAGTFLGGTTFLALGVAGLGALIRPLRASLPRALLLWTAAAPLPLAALALDGRLSRLDGALLLGWFALEMAGIARAARELLVEPGGERVPFAAVRALAGLATLTVGGDLLGRGLRDVTQRFGISPTLFGNTALAAAVEAEEVARVAVPARRGRGDVALANVVGTIVHFAAFNAGLIALVKPIELDHASTRLHLPAAVGATLVLCALLARGRGLGRADGALLLLLYVAYVAVAVATA
jgi:cation:H+ antiporter